MALACFVFISGFGFAQSSNKVEKESKKQTEKRIEVIKENGETTVTITTTENGNTSTEVYTGEAAKAYLEKHNSTSSTCKKMNVNIELDSLDLDWAQDFEGKTEEEIRAIVESHVGDLVNQLQLVQVDILSDSSVVNQNVQVITNDNGKEIVIVNGEEIELKGDGSNVGFVVVKSEDGEIITHHSDDNSFTYTTTIVVERIAKLEDAENAQGEAELEVTEMEMYPNPSDGIFNLKFRVEDNKPTVVTVTDLSGKTVYETKVKGSGEHQIEVDLTDQESGVYLLTLTQKNKVETKKIILQ